jgi:nitroreductase
MSDNASADNVVPDRPALPGAGLMFPRFSSQAIDNDCLARIIEAARPTPSEWHSQSGRWIVVRGEASRKYLQTATYLKVPISSAPAVLISLADTLAWKTSPQYLQEMITDRKITEEEGREALRRVREYYSSSPETAKRTALANAFMAVHQILRGAAESNLSAFWLTEFDEGKIKTHFHIPDHFLVAALLPIGYREGATAPPASKFRVDTFVYHEKFGETGGPTH